MKPTQVLVACLLWLTLVELMHAQVTVDSSGTRPDAEQAWKGLKPVAQCAWCHYQPGNSFASRPTDFCKLDEARHWLNADPHATSRLRIEPWPKGDARAQASHRLSRHIVERLGYQVDTSAGYQKFCENCLTCHAGYQSQTQSALKSEREGQPGISCLYCHQVESNSAWIDLHGAISAPDTWRPLTPDTKQSHGLRHLASADAQAKLCYQCHIGDLSQNMFVSHAMYVAGHPPLPSVELHSLTAAMSPHWRSARDLYTSMSQQPDARDEYFATHLAVRKPLDTQASAAVADWQWNTQATAVGAVQAQQQLLTLMEQVTSERFRQRWADYALYDCAGCHHGLQTPSWRQQHRLNTPPGRPLPMQWPIVLEQIVTHSQAELLSQPRADYLRSITVQPFGDRQQVSVAVKSYRQALEEVQATLVTATLEPQFSRAVLEQLPHISPSHLSDYESAKQLRWAVTNISRDLARTGALSSTTPYELRLPDRAEHYNPADFIRQLPK